MNNEIKGISCAVKNCVHHDAANRCTADHIKVGSCDATSAGDTKCETFESNCCK